MAVFVLLIAALPLLYFVFRMLSATDVPKIKNLPEIPGVPVFGNLLQLGSEHARVAASWVKKYGPVFQARLGNRVHLPSPSSSSSSYWLEKSWRSQSS